MTLTLTEFTPTDVNGDGGKRIEITGDFSTLQGKAFNVFIGPNGDTTDTPCNSAVPGQGFDVFPITTERLVAYLPVLEPNSSGTKYDVFVRLKDGSDDGVFAAAMRVYPAEYHVKTFDYRKLMPPIYDMGPRSFDQLPEVGQPTTDTLLAPRNFLLETFAESFGESDNDIGGLYCTRTIQALDRLILIAATYTWNGTTTITTGDTSEVVVGDWIKLQGDDNIFQISAITPNVDITIDNPNAFLIPTGATASEKITLSAPVETVVDWPDSGKVILDGVIYRYASKTLDPPSLDGLTHTQGGDQTTPGIKQLHREQSTVTDLSQNRTSMDFVRRALFVDSAEGEDLNAIGRNLGVLRLPFLADDEQFREIIKALAYNPRGTLLGLRLALNGLVGEGNYTITEDFFTPNFNRVFIELTGAAATTDSSQGKAYLTDLESNPSTASTTVDIQFPIITRGGVGRVKLKDEEFLTPTVTAYPSAQILTEYVGDPGRQVWTPTGGTEGADMVLLTGGSASMRFTTPIQNLYVMDNPRVQPESDISISFLATLPVTPSTDNLPVFGVELDDGTKKIGLSLAPSNASDYQAGLCDMGGSFFAGAPNNFAKSDTNFIDFTIVKKRQDSVEFYVDGALTQIVDYNSFAASSGTVGVTFGYHSIPSSFLDAQMKHIAITSKTFIDYWAARGTGADAIGATRQLDVNIPSFFSAPDVGKQVRVFGSSTPNAQNGNNNGRFLIESVDTDEIVTLVGAPQVNGATSSGDPTRFTLAPGGYQFQFPDDLGKKVVITNSLLGNNGTYVIDKLLDQGTFTDLESFATQIPQKTSVCEFVSAAFVTEAGLDWHLEPDFVAESGLSFELADAGAVSGTTLTIRQALPATLSLPVVLDVLYSRVLSAQVLLDINTNNVLLTEAPVQFSHYPFYLSDPLGFVRTYLDDITAAGVIPDFEII